LVIVSVTGWSLVRFAHVLAAMGWVGGQLALSIIVLPVLRGRLDATERAPLIREMARRFAIGANVVLLPLLLLTGLLLAWHRGVTLGTFNDPGYGRLLGIKLALVVAAVGLAAVHGVLAASRPASARPLAIAGLASSIGVVVFATALVP
jgi:putative copper export protein